MDTSAERDCIEIRLRAERKCGQLLKLEEKNKGGKSEQKPYPSQRASGKKTLKQRGISHTQSSRFHNWPMPAK